MKATGLYGIPNTIPDCYITIPAPSQTAAAAALAQNGLFGGLGGFAAAMFRTTTIAMRSLPEISDSKQATYNSENIIGRSFPLYTYSHSGDRQISIQIHFFVLQQGDCANNLQQLRAIQSAAYPRPGNAGAPYMPPVVCTLKCGHLIAKEPVCAILQTYSVKFPTEVVWYEDQTGLYCPARFDVDTSWLVVYTSSDLPYQDRIFTTGR